MNLEGKEQSLLTFRVGPVLCCAPSLPVRSIITPPKLTHPPGADSSQPGIFKHGSHIVKVLDLRQKFGVDKKQQTQPGNLIVCIFEKESFAFWVDQILDVFDFPSKGWGNIPVAIPRGVFTRTLLLNKKIHLYSELENLATINDLGYLESYIQQLQQQDEIKAIKKVDTKSASSKTSTINKNSDQETKTAKAIKATSSPLSKTTKQNQITPITQPVKKEYSTGILKNTLPKKKSPAVVSTQTTKILKTPSNDSNKISAAPISPHEKNIKKQEKILPVTSNTASAKPNPKNNHEIKHVPPKDSSMGFIIFFLIIIILLGVGFYYFLFDKNTFNSKYKNSKNVEKIVPVQTEEYIPIEVMPTEIEKNTTVKPLDMDNAVENQTIESETKEYKAEISQRDNEITITVHAPLAIDKNQIEETKTTISKPDKIKDKEKIESTVTDISVEILKPEEIAQPVIEKKIIKEVIHTVVKGDTLWAIAKKYVKNPFLYPELARLSNIKNPHRIYPGNRVRIRFINK